jgi:hypothetical protein
MRTTVLISSVALLVAGAMLLIALTASNAHAAAPATTIVVTVDAVAARASNYKGKPIVLHGIVHHVSKARRMFTLIDPSEANCTDACQPNMIVATLATEKAPLPEARREVLVHGTLESNQSPLRIRVTRVISDPQQIKAALAAKE